MASSMEGMTLFEALEQLVKEGRSGRLQVSHWDGKEGAIGLNNGHIVHCQFGKLRGMKALGILRNWMSISTRMFENVENLNVDLEEDTRAILSSLETHDKEVKRIQEVIPSAQAIFALSSDTPATRVSLDRKLWKVLSLINGRNSVKDICLALRANEFSVSRVLSFLYARRIIRMVAVQRPMATRLRDLFFQELETGLAEHIGPIAPVVVDDTLTEMNKSREYVTRNDLPLLVERIGGNIEEEDERIRFQSHMLACIQRISKGET